MHTRLAMIVRAVANHGTDGGPVPGQPSPTVTPVPSTHAHPPIHPQHQHHDQHDTMKSAQHPASNAGGNNRRSWPRPCAPVTPACGYPYNLGRLGGRRLGGCRRHTGRNHEDTRTPSRLCRTGWVPAPAHTRCAILVTLGVAPMLLSVISPPCCVSPILFRRRSRRYSR